MARIFRRYFTSRTFSDDDKRIDDDHREFILKPIGKKYEELVKEIEYENNCHG